MHRRSCFKINFVAYVSLHVASAEPYTFISITVTIIKLVNASVFELLMTKTIFVMLYICLTETLKIFLSDWLFGSIKRQRLTSYTQEWEIFTLENWNSFSNTLHFRLLILTVAQLLFSKADNDSILITALHTLPPTSVLYKTPIKHHPPTFLSVLVSLLSLRIHSPAVRPLIC